MRGLAVIAILLLAYAATLGTRTAEGRANPHDGEPQTHDTSYWKRFAKNNPDDTESDKLVVYAENYRDMWGENGTWTQGENRYTRDAKRMTEGLEELAIEMRAALTMIASASLIVLLAGTTIAPTIPLKRMAGIAVAMLIASASGAIVGHLLHADQVDVTTLATPNLLQLPNPWPDDD